MIKVLCIFGTRPEAIKMAPVIWALQQQPERFVTRVCATAQHREMLDQMLATLALTPDVDLDLMEPGQTLNQLAARVLARLEPVLEAERPDWVLVQGDTTTVLAGALAAHHLRIRVGHVEAGLRTGDRWNPFPEEMNRVLADHLSDLCFAPTERACQNLLQDGIPESRIRLTGNTVTDALLWATRQPTPPEAVALLEQAGLPAQPQSPADAPRLILVTAHRRESFGAPLERICQAIRAIAEQGAGAVKLIYPVHPNPNVQAPVQRWLSGVPHVTLAAPVDYLTLVALMQRSALILTDSGGIQEEAPSLGVPVLVLRDVTERPEAVEAGVARVVGTDAQRIVAETFHLLNDPAAHAAMARGVNPYGDGYAAERIVAALLQE
ncbi:MAG TPA: UDP-N-acetylglucosamine 2-epimerase (non-hydrolyzing) [Anaerolineae bacterium]|nr:UDP-N-acetylglucosamine 2-epimerase (non-hydrolyzing) [Anaerolineae bacterium]HQI83143.1 UDP-N-acetylglucosamine 2-epimerase (non-hydrolyzing) [Anaerolineae bacterium]